jgi:hypothetical protein
MRVYVHVYAHPKKIPKGGFRKYFVKNKITVLYLQSHKRTYELFEVQVALSNHYQILQVSTINDDIDRRLGSTRTLLY